jgi:hypothetical protein
MKQEVSVVPGQAGATSHSALPQPRFASGESDLKSPQHFFLESHDD